MMDLNFQTLLERYSSGERDFQGFIVRSVDGFESNLRAINLNGSIWVKAYLPYSNLSQASLRNFEMQGGSLADAKLFSTDLTNAVLMGTDCSRADLRYACLKGANLQQVDLSGADLTAADLTGADLTGALLSRANLSQAVLTRACLHSANLFRAVKADWQEAICDRTTILPDGHHFTASEDI